MFSKDSFFAKMIKEICEEKNIEYEFLSFDYIIRLKKNGKISHFRGYSFDLNGQASRKNSK